MIDYNDAEPQVEFELIPHNTIARAKIVLNPGQDPSDPFLTESKSGDSAYLNCEFIILEGPHAKRKIFEKVGVKGTEHWVNFGRARIRAILESAKNINPKDTSEAAVRARKINSYDELDNLTVMIKIGIERDKKGLYSDKNRIVSILIPGDAAYRAPHEDIPSTDKESEYARRA
jgi:hypothetical protein